MNTFVLLTFFFISFIGDSITVTQHGEGIAAHNGWRTDHVLAKTSVCGNVSPLECVYSTEHTNIAVIELGTNDLLINEPDQYARNIDEILRTSYARNVRPVVLNVIPRMDGDWESKVAAYNYWLEIRQKQYGFKLIDMHSAFYRCENLCLDDMVHPNKQGYAIRQTLIDEALKEIVPMITEKKSVGE